mgnify:CR=1 FL=1
MTKARDTAKSTMRDAKELHAEPVANVSRTDDHLVEILARIARRIAQTAPDFRQSK